MSLGDSISLWTNWKIADDISNWYRQKHYIDSCPSTFLLKQIGWTIDELNRTAYSPTGGYLILKTIIRMEPKFKQLILTYLVNDRNILSCVKRASLLYEEMVTVEIDDSK